MCTIDFKKKIAVGSGAKRPQNKLFLELFWGRKNFGQFWGQELRACNALKTARSSCPQNRPNRRRIFLKTYIFHIYGSSWLLSCESWLSICINYL